MGYYEGGFTKGTIDIAHMIAESGAMSIVGGGDTATVLYDENILHKFTFVSMAGGAMLEYLAEGTLPGIEVLK
jgi:phosphoglycerate kinase